MKKAPFLAALFALTLFATDFWQSKPFTEWNPKEVQKILQNSPWSKSFSVSGGNGGVTSAGERGRARSHDTEPDPGQISATSNGPAGASDPGGLGRYAGSRGDPGTESSAVPMIDLVVRWQSSLPVRQAIVKEKYGSEAGTSEAAKKALDTPLDHYIIAVGGLPGSAVAGDADALKQSVLPHTSLSVKGKPALKPDDLAVQKSGRVFELLLAFPKTTPITEADREVEFTAKIGGFSIRQKFRLKDMALGGKLDL
ncbi:MAG TPA: hypothetical protein VMG40_12770 [Bryobacteraceae bacterium]|nr:hypothetical protein [Bryobacteraceae bacterium]